MFTLAEIGLIRNRPQEMLGYRPQEMLGGSERVLPLLTASDADRATWQVPTRRGHSGRRTRLPIAETSLCDTTRGPGVLSAYRLPFP
jgi:hypothetical protein